MAHETRQENGRRTCRHMAGVMPVIALVASMCGCMPVAGIDGTSAGIVSASVPQRVVTQIINNTCGDDSETSDSESLSSGEVSGLSKVLNGFGVPYDERADGYTVRPSVVTDDSYEANKERGIGYTGIEDHYVAALAPGQSHSPDHPEFDDVGAAMFTNLTTKEEQYGCAMRWEYYNPDLSGPAVDGYMDFLTGNGSGHMQYLAVHATKTDKWVICCPYDWGPALNLPTTGGGKYAGGRIGGLSPAAAEALGITDGGAPENAMTEWWWVENSSQVECGPIEDLSQLTKQSTGTNNNQTQTKATIHLLTQLSTTLTNNINRNSNAEVKVAPANANSFVSAFEDSYILADMPADSIGSIILHDIEGQATDARSATPCQRSHFVIDKDGRIIQQVHLSSSATHTANDTENRVTIGIALVHDGNTPYGKRQLNSLDRLVAYIDGEIGKTVPIIGHDTGECMEQSGFPESAYNESRNHSNVKTMQDALKASENGECSDEEVSDSESDGSPTGGEGIAAKAVEISGSAVPKPAIAGAWDEVPSSSCLSAYVSEKNRVYPDVPGWADCGRCAATAVKASGADDGFPAHMDTAYQYSYMTESPKWQRVGTMRTGDTPDSLCKPGDVLVTEGKGHIMIYVGNDAVKKKYPESEANFFEGSMGQYYGWCYNRKTYDGARPYAIFRCIKPDNSNASSGGRKKMAGKSSSSDSSLGKTNRRGDYNVPSKLDGMPVSQSWFSDDADYMRMLREKARFYGRQSMLKEGLAACPRKTMEAEQEDGWDNWILIMDVDLARLGIFQRSGGGWKAVGGWDTIQGVRDTRRNGDYGFMHMEWSGPRSSSFKQATHVHTKTTKAASGDRNKLCYTCADPNHAKDCWSNCQQFEVWGGGQKPYELTVDEAHTTLGCCNLSAEEVQWMLDNIPTGTAVVIFDQYNQWPRWHKCDASQSAETINPGDCYTDQEVKEGLAEAGSDTGDGEWDGTGRVNVTVTKA